MSKFIRELNRLDNNLYPRDYNQFQSQIDRLIRSHLDLFCVDAGSFSLEHHNNGRRGYVSIDISQLYENFITNRDRDSDLNLIWVDSSDIQNLQAKLAGETWFLGLKQMVKEYDSAHYVNLCLSVIKAQQIYRGKSLPVFVSQIPIASRGE